MTGRDRTRTAAEQQRHPIGDGKAHVPQVPLTRQLAAGLLEPIRQIDSDDRLGFFRDGDRNTTGAAPDVEHTSDNRHSRTREKCEHLGAEIVLELGVVVLRAEPDRGVGLNRGFVNRAH